jgi:hypothetical protein
LINISVFGMSDPAVGQAVPGALAAQRHSGRAAVNRVRLAGCRAYACVRSRLTFDHFHSGAAFVLQQGCLSASNPVAGSFSRRQYLMERPSNTPGMALLIWSRK